MLHFGCKAPGGEEEMRLTIYNMLQSYPILMCTKMLQRISLEMNVVRKSCCDLEKLSSLHLVDILMPRTEV
jgi:hypothetical protein